jgi:hypothetical protein
MKKQFLAAFFFTALYALIRYAGFGHVALIHVPVYILNKAICMTAVESLLMASIGLMRAERDAVRFWTAACTQLVFVHVFLSLGILSKGYYVHFFDGDKMSLTGEVVVLTGVLAVYCFWRLQATGLKPAVRRPLTILACLLVAGHLFAMGYNDTLQVEKWNGGLPPMSMLSFFLAVSSLIVFARTPERALPESSGEERVLPPEMDPL